MVRSLDELVSTDAPAIDMIRQWIESAESPCTILPPSDERARTLLAVQVATNLPLGAIAYETGGILVDHGWLRFLGSGHADLPRNLADWNAVRGEGMCLVAEDVIGGFFAIDRGAFGDDADMYYWAPDRLQWEPIGFEFDFFFRWSLTSALEDFYQHFRWRNWVGDIAHALPVDHCFSFESPLWIGSEAITSRTRHTQPVADLFDAKLAAQRESDG